MAETQNDKQMQQQNNKAKPIIHRMMEAWGLEKENEIGGKLNRHHKTAANWTQKKDIPLTAIYKCHLATGRSMDWLLYGDSTAKITSNTSIEEIKRLIAPILQMTIDGGTHTNLNINTTIHTSTNIITITHIDIGTIAITHTTTINNPTDYYTY